MSPFRLLVLLLLLLLSSSSVSVAMQQMSKHPRASPAAFWSWCRTHIVAPKVGIHNFGGLRGLIATDDIAKGEVILTVPLSMCFVRESDDDKWPCELALDMIEEMDKGSESKWYPYLSALPTAADLRALLPVHWPAEALEAFSNGDFIFEDDVKLACENSWAWRDHVWVDLVYRNKRLSASKEGRRDAVQSRLAPRALQVPTGEGLMEPSYRVQNRRLVELQQLEEDGEDREEEKERKKTQACTRAQFEYALDLVQTRNCCPDRVGSSPARPEGAGQRPALHLVVPLLDFLNHSPEAETHMEVDDEKQIVRLLTRRPIARGGQLYLNYHLEEQIYSPLKSGAGGAAGGAAPPAFQMDVAAYALTSYGFVPSPLEEVSILLPLETIRGVLVDAATADLFAGDGREGVREGSALAILQACGIQISQPFTAYRDGISTSLLGCYRVLAMSSEERETLWAAGKEAQRAAVLGQGRMGPAVRAQLGALLAEERAKHGAVVAGVSGGSTFEDGEETDGGQGAPQRARRRYSMQASEVLSSCEQWLAGLRE